MATHHIKLSAAQREKAGKGVARALRRENRVPAVIYGDGKEPVSISLTAKDVNLEYRKGHMFTSLTDLDVGGAKHLVLARDVQLDPVNDFVLHVDFLRVTPKTKIAVKVPVHFINEEECPAISAGGVLNIVRHEVELFCAATDIPESIEADLKGLEIGDAVKISDIKLPQGAKPTITDRDFTIATLVAPKVVEEEAPVAAEGAEGEAAEGEAKEGDAKDAKDAKGGKDKD